MLFHASTVPCPASLIASLPTANTGQNQYLFEIQALSKYTRLVVLTGKPGLVRSTKPIVMDRSDLGQEQIGHGGRVDKGIKVNGS